MQGSKPESFVRGAVILSLAALVSRLMGAFYKPIIARIFAPYDGFGGAVGIGLTQVPLSAYQVILSFTSVGLNVGIAKLVSERMALGDVAGARRVFRSSLSMMAGLGLLAALGLWFGAPWVAAGISPEVLDTVPGFRAVAPALLITSVLAAYRGLFQGFQQMAPSAYSQILEQLVRVAAGLLLTFYLVRVSVPLGAAGYNFGDVVGAAAALLYMLYLVRRAGDHLWQPQEQAATTESTAAPPKPSRLPGGWRLAARIFSVAGPITIAGAVVPLMMLADTVFVFRALSAGGVTGVAAQAQFGLLTNAFMIVNLPGVFTTAVYTSILPAISAAMAVGQVDLARRRASQAYRLTFLLAVPSAVGLYVLATGIYRLLFGDPAGGTVMAAIAPAALVIMLQQTSSGILQGMGLVGMPVRHFALGAAVKIGLTAWWTVAHGINGAAWATVAGFGLAALLNLIQVERKLGRTLRTRSMIIKPLAAAGAMAGAIWLLTPYLGHGALATLGLIALGGGLFGLVLLLVGGVSRRDVEAIPRLGRPLAGLLGRTRLLR